MSDRMFYTLLSVIVAIGVIVTASLVAYTAYQYLNCSIITYIASEVWR